MMRWVVGSSLRLKGLIVVIAAALLFFGITKLRDTPVDVLPEFGSPTVEVQTEALGLSAEEVEQLITVPMEQDLLAGVAFLDTIRSTSVPGLSSIEMIFEPGTDPLVARQVVAERLTQAHALPNVSRPPQMIQPKSSTSRVMMIGVSSKKLSLIELSVLARWTIVPRLTGVSGVSNVSVWGQRERQLQVQVNPEELQAKGVTLHQIVKTTANALWVSPLSYVEASTPGTGGFIDTANQRLSVQHLSPIRTADDLSQVSVEDIRGPPLLLGDVATVVEDHQPLIGDAVLSSGPGLLLVVEKFPEANTLDVTRGLDHAIGELKPGLAGVDFDTGIYRPATYIESSFDNLQLWVIIGGVLMALAIAGFLFAWRSALVAIVAIPVSLVAGGLVLHALGETVNALIVAGLVLALVVLVDDAVVDTESSKRRLANDRTEGSERPKAGSILEASLEMRGPMIYATLIIALTVLPLFFLRGESGAFLEPLALAYLVAIAASLAVALTLTPALTLILASRGRLGTGESPLVKWLQQGHERLLTSFLPRPAPVFVAVGAFVVAGFAAIPFLDRGTSLVPSFKDANVLVRWDSPPGTSLPEQDRIVARASNELRALPGVRDVGAHAGRAITSDQVVDVNSSELWVNVDPSADYDSTLDSIRDVVAGYPGLDRAVLTYPNQRVEDVLAEEQRPVVVRVYGQDYATLQNTAQEVANRISQVDGVVDPSIERVSEQPTLEIETNLEAAERYGIKPGDVRRAATTLLSGIEVGSLFEDQKVFAVVVWGVPTTRQSLTDVDELLIDTPSGGHVRLGDVATVRVAPDPDVIRHDAVRRSLDVTANVSGRGVGSVLDDVERSLASVAFPLEYHAEVLGDARDRQATHWRIIAISVAAAIGIFLLLQSAFGSWRLATLSFVTAPLALTGSALAALALGGESEISIGSLVGFFAIFALAARNGILLLRHYQHLERHEGETFGLGLVLRGTRERLVPILATATASALALIPLVIAGAGPGEEIIQPLAVVVIGGLVTATLLNVFVLPALYLRFGSTPAPVEGEIRPQRLADLLRQRGQALARGRKKLEETPSGSDTNA